MKGLQMHEVLESLAMTHLPLVSPRLCFATQLMGNEVSHRLDQVSHTIRRSTGSDALELCFVLSWKKGRAFV